MVEAWADLPLVGYMRVEEVCAEMRNCACGSTISVRVPCEMDAASIKRVNPG
jgi:hypothetical protein